MAHLWVEETAGEWAVIRLESSSVPLAVLSDTARTAPRGRWPQRVSPGGVRATLRRAEGPTLHGWYLVAAPADAIWINGLRLISGMRALVDRDEIRLAAGAVGFFSTEVLACVTPMVASERPTVCPRCRQDVVADTPAVRCPACALWHHQADALPCWTYAPTCALCPQPSALNAGYRWTPEDL